MEEDKSYKELQKALLAILSDLERVKSHGKVAIRSSSRIGGPLKKETAALMKEFDRLALQCLKLEQETREI